MKINGETLRSIEEKMRRLENENKQAGEKMSNLMKENQGREKTLRELIENMKNNEEKIKKMEMERFTRNLGPHDFHTRGDVTPFLSALEAGFSDLKFSVRFSNPLNATYSDD